MGKTCLINRYVNNKTPKKYGPTIGVELVMKEMRMSDGVTVKAQIWDTNGSEKYRAITTAHYRKALGALIVFDLTKYESFESTKFWLEQVLENSEQEIQIKLIGNKVDLVQ